MMKQLAILLTIFMGILVVSGCASVVGTRSAAAKPPTTPTSPKPASEVQAKAAGSASVSPGVSSAQNRVCPVPAGWVAYQMQTNETIFSIAARAGISAGDLLAGNCLTSAVGITMGAWIAVPPGALATQPQTILPLGISAFIADPVRITAGAPVTLAWQSQGPVINVRIGWLYQGQFIEEAANLPTIGTWTLAAPDDGRTVVTYMVRASDGLSEVAAQTTVQIACSEGWFFAPAPLECPSPPLMTTFYEQPFERGSIVFIPALRVHYVLIQGQPGRQVADQFVPGMPLHDPALEGTIPPGMEQPQGAIYYAWRSDAGVMTGLGYATGPAQHYTGLPQRTLETNGREAIYFSSRTGTIYRFGEGQMWRVLVAQ